MTNIKIVKCKICGKVLKTRANHFFRCCHFGQSIKDNLVLEGVVLKSKKTEIPDPNFAENEAKNSEIEVEFKEK